VRSLLGDRVTDVRATTASVAVTQFPGSGDFRGYFASHYGPTMATYRAVADDPQLVADLDAAIDALADRFTDAGVMSWEYLLLTCTRV